MVERRYNDKEMAAIFRAAAEEQQHGGPCSSLLPRAIAYVSAPCMARRARPSAPALRLSV